MTLSELYRFLVKGTEEEPYKSDCASVNATFPGVSDAHYGARFRVTFATYRWGPKRHYKFSALTLEELERKTQRIVELLVASEDEDYIGPAHEELASLLEEP